MATEVTAERVLELLSAGELEPVGRLPGASNETFLATISHGDLETYAVYKPRDGEAPLWDFPDGTLYRREMAAYVVSRALGWDFVPPTIVRDGPFGVGVAQLFIEHDPAEHYLTLQDAHPDVFRRVAAFDLMINNGDRKAGHCLLQHDTGRIFAVDHGVSFHAQPKLRTVIWEYEGEPIPPGIVAAVASFAEALAGGPVRASLDALLDPLEISALQVRAASIVARPVYPEPGPGRPYPWPPI
jgi:phosphoinositide 3-/4-kinase-like protein